MWVCVETGSGTDGLDDGVLDDPLLALFAAARRDADSRVSPGAVAQLKVHTHSQVFEQRVEDLQHRGPYTHTHIQSHVRVFICSFVDHHHGNTDATS